MKNLRETIALAASMPMRVKPMREIVDRDASNAQIYEKQSIPMSQKQEE